MSLYSELKRRNVFRVGAAYAVTAWLLVQVAETIFPLFGIGDTPARIVVIVAITAFVPTVVLAWAFELTPKGLKREKDVDRSGTNINRFGRQIDFAIIGILTISVAYFLYDKFYLDPARDSLTTVTTVEGLAEVQNLVGEGQFAAAYARAKELDSLFVEESLKKELWGAVSTIATVQTEPSGARVWARPYNSSESDWEYVGETPVSGARLPLNASRFRVELEGHRSLYVYRNLRWSNPDFQLDPVEDIPESMVRVPGGIVDVLMPGLDHLLLELPDFYIDKFEVTNKQYKEFVDANGYSRPEFWEHEFVRGDEVLTFEDAIGLFKDMTGQPGPSTWQLGGYPDGAADHPVAGISWYEAAAYARFKNMELPTVFHWYQAIGPTDSGSILPRSNFSKVGTVQVGSLDGISWTGVFDGAGNVREWMWNEHKGDRFLLGGGWSDPEYMFTDSNAQSPFDRSEINGVRLMHSLDETNLTAVKAPIELPGREYWTEEPVSDDLLQVFVRQYSYDKSPLNAQVVASEETPFWVREKVELDAAYGGERLTTYIFVPHDREPPYSPVIFFPGAGAIYFNEFPPADKFQFEFLIRSGNAVVYPIYKGTFDRGTELPNDIQNDSNSYRNHVISWSQDLGRSLDYLESRSEFEMSELMYFSLSWGSAIAPIMIAVEPRIQLSVLVSGGLLLQPTQPEVDPFNFLPRVSVPTKMINIPNDFFYALEASQKPFFDKLGSEHKEHVLLDGGHLPPLNHVARETLNWIDRYRGVKP